ncbi:MAG: hypothetical protein NTV46_20255 [Verrucomicrobia bacterium]|nr:hypothetical protein [Verrucomicrobiota bacterium]
MRVPNPWVLLLALAVIVSIWWYGIRKTDFLTPPSASKLAEIRAQVEASLPETDHPDDAVSAPPVVKEPEPPAPVEKPKPVIELGDITRTPTLHEYSNLAPRKGAAYLMDLAVLLEAKDASQRALLAWERVLDTAKPDRDQAGTAIAAIIRLRPTVPDWNTERAKTIAITLHAGTGKKYVKTLIPVLEKSARELERASAGILKVTTLVHASRGNPTVSGPAPVALWFTGSAKNSLSTAVLSFTIQSPQSLHDDLRKALFQLLREQLGQNTARTPPVALADREKALDALNSHITRLGWAELGTQLKPPPKKDEPLVKKPKVH